MAVVTSVSASPAKAISVSEVTLASTNTVSYTIGTGGILMLRNPTVSPIVAVIDGDGGAVVNVKDLGEIDISAGFAIGSVAAGAAVALRLDAIKGYLSGVISITGTGLVATLITP
jgi:hypothetical protein